MVTCGKDVVVVFHHLDEGGVEQELGAVDRRLTILPHSEQSKRFFQFVPFFPIFHSFPLSLTYLQGPPQIEQPNQKPKVDKGV